MRTREMQAEEAAVDVKFCLMFPREALSVPVMRHVLGDTLRQLGVDDDSVGDLLLAVTEACTNVLQHSGQGHRYEVVASVSPSGCLLEVLDSGTGFRPGLLVRHRVAAHFPARHHRLRRRLAAASGSAASDFAAPEPGAAVPEAGAHPALPPAGPSAGPQAGSLASPEPLTGPVLRRGLSALGGTPAPAGPRSLTRPRGRFARARRYASDRAIADLAESGRGLAIMRACVDNVTLRSGPGRGTVVSLQKHINWRREPPPAVPPPARLRDTG
ncbi:MAG: ATP-binding protein [Actinomycetota bacterium]